MKLVERTAATLFSAAVIIIGVATVGGGLHSFAAQRGLSVGRTAPPFALALADEQGYVIDSSRLGGNVVLLAFWDSDCAACTDTLATANSLQREFGERGFIAVSVNTDSLVDEVNSRDAARRIAPDIIRTSDVYGVVRGHYSARTQPRWVLIGGDGRIAAFSAAPAPGRDAVIAALSS